MISILALAALVATAAPLPPVIGIAVAGDGDSLTVGQTKIRLFGIDAPELNQTCTRGGSQWGCGAEAADRLSRLVTGQQVFCVALGEDDYGRTLARCTVGSVDVNRTMVETGYAVAFRKYSTDYVAAEDRAKAAKLGLWSGTFEMPQEYRSGARAAKPRQAAPRRNATRRAAPSSTGCAIKGNHSRKGEWIYHLPGMPYYAETRPEAIFCTEEQARAAGYRRSRARW
jgi:endonuclease YncB( thermonuclease family)